MVSWIGLLEASVTGGICIALFLLASRLFGERYRAKYRKVVWLLIALRLCVPVSFSVVPKLFTVQMPVLVLGESESGMWEKNMSPAASPQSKSLEDGQADTALPIDEGKAGMDGAEISRPLTSQDMLVALWGCGCIAVLLYYLSAHFIFYRRVMKKRLICEDESILAITAKAAGEMGLKTIPQVWWIQDAHISPFTMGFLKNSIVLPKTGYQERDLQYIIRHELAHCAAKDTRIKALILVLNAVHWFNPFVWFMKSMVDQDMELACDERVLEDTSKEERSEYSEVLMSWIGTDKGSRPLLSTGYVQGVKFIKKRFRNIFNTRKKSGKAAVGVFVIFLMAVSACVGFEAGRTVYAKNKISIDRGIELRTDMTGDGQPDQVQVRDHNDWLVTTLSLKASDGREAYFTYDEELWASSMMVSGDLSGNGAADIVLLRTTFGMHGDGPVSVLHVTEEEGQLIWQEYPENFVHNSAIDKEQPNTFGDIACVDATIIEENGRHYLRLTVLEEVGYDEDILQNIDCALQEEGWLILNMQTITDKASEGMDTEPSEGGQEAPSGNDLETGASNGGDNSVITGNSGISGDVQELEGIVRDFYEAYFEGDEEAIKRYLTDPYTWDIEVYEGSYGEIEISAVKGLEEAEGKNINDGCVIWVEYKESGDDSNTYLTIQFVKTETGWKVEFYGIEK